MKMEDTQIADLMAQVTHLPRHVRIAIGVGIFVLIHVLSYFLIWSSQFVELETAEQSISTGIATLQQDSKKLLDRPKYDLELKRLRALLPELQRALPQEKEIPPLLSKVNEVIRKNQLKLTEFAPQNAVTQNVMLMIPVKLTVSGDGVSIAKLPATITGLSRKITLNKFSITQTQEGDKWMLTGELRAYAQLPVEPTTETTGADSAHGAVDSPGQSQNIVRGTPAVGQRRTQGG